MTGEYLTAAAIQDMDEATLIDSAIAVYDMEPLSRAPLLAHMRVRARKLKCADAFDSLIKAYEAAEQANGGQDRAAGGTPPALPAVLADDRLTAMVPEQNARYGWQDMGNGNLFADYYKNIARFVPERKRWFVYDGKKWAQDVEHLRIMELCKRLADALIGYALTIQDERLRDNYLTHVKRWQRRNYRETIIKDAASVYPMYTAELDADPFIFNCLNGTLDLRTGVLGAHDPGDKLSKVAGVRYAPDATCARWMRFIDEVMEGDAEKAAYLQKAMGYALTGDTRHECFFILYGPTSRNGKGTTMETYMRLMGDYGRSTKPDTIAQKQTANGSGPSEDIARLAGARFVNVSEPDQKLILSAATVKSMTGNDTIVARHLQEGSFEYRPQFKLFINTNHLPKVTDVSLFSSGRVKLIPFERHFMEAERDGGLKNELSSDANMSGILNWCMEGLRMIEAQGFDMPDTVRDATDEYRSKSDKMGLFLADEMVRDPMAEVKTNDVYERFKGWCMRNGYQAQNAANFKGDLSNVAVIRNKRPNGAERTATVSPFLVGYRLKTGYGDAPRTPTPVPKPQSEQKVIRI